MSQKKRIILSAFMLSQLCTVSTAIGQQLNAKIHIDTTTDITYSFYDGDFFDMGKTKDLINIMTGEISGEKLDDREEIDNIINRTIEGGGFAAAQAVELRDAMEYIDKCKKGGGVIDENKPIKLVSASMEMNVNLYNGRGLFDISSIKMIECYYPGGDGAFDTKILSRRWVVSVSEGIKGKAGTLQDPVKDPSGKEYPYKIYVHEGEGIGIAMIKFYYDNKLVEPEHPKWAELRDLYNRTDTACIDIFFPNVPPLDGEFHSVPGNAAFCAGGGCKNKNPGFDATM